MTQRVLHLAKDLSLPLDAVTQTFAIFGKRGSGKTNGATVLVEELLTAHQPVVILDPVDAWWGLKASFNGKGPGFPVYVFGGAHGDLPLEASAGSLIADVVAKERLPLVLSMKLWSVGERARFVTDFAKRLLQVNTAPVMMVLEEADAFIPQRPGKGEEAMLGAMDRLVRWGRQSGVGCTIVTQRSAKVNKDVTTQAETLIAFRTTGPQDRDAIDAWIKYHAGDEQRDEVLSTLPTLPNGTAWVWSPEWLGVLQKVAVRRRSTFDSAATPKVGQKTTQPKKLAPVDLEQLRTQMAETVEKAKAEDPRELRKQIAELKKTLAAKSSVAVPKETISEKRVEVPVLKDRQIARLEKIYTRMLEKADAYGKSMVLLWEQQSEEAKALLDVLRVVANVPKVAATVHQMPAPASARRATPRPLNGNLKPMHRAMLIALAQHPDGLTKKQIHVHTGYASSGSTSAAFADLAREQWVTTDGNRLTLTPTGGQVLGDFDPLPVGDALRQWLLSGDKLSTMEKALLARIAHAYPEAIQKHRVLDGAQYASSGSTSAAFAKLVAYGYAIPQGHSMLKAAEELFS
jgi:hypothetical protein